MSLLSHITFKRVYSNILSPYWDVAENPELRTKENYLVDAFSKVALNEKVAKALKVAIEKRRPDFIDNVFTHAASKMPVQDLIKMCNTLSNSTVFLALHEGLPNIAKDIVLVIAKRMPLEHKEELLCVVDESRILKSVLISDGGYISAKFFAEVVKNKSDEEAVNRLRKSVAWQCMERSQFFIEWVAEVDNRLLAALH